MTSPVWSRSNSRIAVLVGFVAVACDVRGSARSSSDAAPIIRDSAGVTIVENTSGDSASMPRWSIDTTPELTIGKMSDDPAYEFAMIGDVTQLPNGTIVVLNGRGEAAFEFRFYDSTGKHIATHGRRGQGPGEYQWINFVGSVGGDTVIGVDFPSSRLNWVSASKGYLRSTRLDINGFKKVLGDDASGMIETMVPLGDSVYAVLAFRRIPNALSLGQRGQSYHIVDLAADTALDLVRYDDPPYKVVQLSTGPTHLAPRGTGDPARVVDRSRNRICALITNVTMISCIDRTGKRSSIRWRHEPVAYTADDRRAVEESIRRRPTGPRGPTPQDIERVIAAIESPEHHPPIAAFELDSEGNFWILEPTLDATGKRQSRFRIFAPDGRQIAFADPFPTGHIRVDQPIHIGSSSVLRVIETPDGAPAVGVFRIQKPE
jgi:hypothetical protein